MRTNEINFFKRLKKRNQKKWVVHERFTIKLKKWNASNSSIITKDRKGKTQNF